LAAPLPDGWERIPPEQAAGTHSDFVAEVGSGHPLYGVTVQPLAYLRQSDDILVRVEGDPVRFAVVHLTYDLRPEPPPWPSTTFLDPHCIKRFRTGPTDVRSARRGWRSTRRGW
jgi:hypothetical protein